MDLIVSMLYFIYSVRDPNQNSTQTKRTILDMKQKALQLFPVSEFKWTFPNWDSSKFNLYSLHNIFTL